MSSQHVDEKKPVGFCAERCILRDFSRRSAMVTLFVSCFV